MMMNVMDWVTVTTALVIAAVSLLAYRIWKKQEKFKTFAKMGLPGPPPNFLAGNTGRFAKEGFVPAFLEWGKKYGKCYGIYLPDPVFVISDPELLRDLMVKKFNDFPNRAVQKSTYFKPWKDNLTMLKNDRWKHIRSQLSPTFSSGKLKRMMPAIDRVVENLDSHIKEKAQTAEDVELRHVAGCFTMDVIAGAAFGIHLDCLKNPDDPFNVNGLALQKLNKWIMPLLMLFPRLAPILHRFGLGLIPQAPTKFFMDMITAALEDRRKDPKTHNDFLQLLVDAEKEGGANGPVDAEIDHAADLATSASYSGRGLTDDEMIANGMVFFLAGFDTTSIVLSFTLFHLAANPEAVRKAQQEVDEKLGKKPVRYDTAPDLTYLDMCMNEAIRLNPPGFMLDREAVQDTELGGYPIKAGTRVVIPVCSLHRDPEYWAEPDKFIPERHTSEAKAARHPFAFVPFGYGPRNCIGMRLAQLEIRMALATLLQHYTPVLCDKSVYPPVLETPQVRMTTKDGLWVKFQPRE